MPSSPPICIFALTTLTTLHLWRSLETSGSLLPSLFVLRGGEGARGERREKGIDTVRFREPNTAKVADHGLEGLSTHMDQVNTYAEAHDE
eukprot:1327761-Amorphochlora_amoeboformis.AAC.1